jgi:hypothetical protein
MAEAYKRLVNSPEDPYGVCSSPESQEANQNIAKAKLIAMQSTFNLPNSGTPPSPDLVYAIVEGKQGRNILFCKELANTNANPLFLATENETNGVLLDFVTASLESFWQKYEQSNSSVVASIGSGATTLFSATQLRAKIESSTAKRSIEDHYSWVKAVYDLVRNGLTSRALRVVYSSVEDHFRKGELASLGEILGSIDVTRLNPQTSTALLRISGRARRALPAWKNLLLRTKAELVRQNVADLPGLLVGLDQ